MDRHTESPVHQIEVKRSLVEHRFPSSEGWTVIVDLDPMELGKGGKHPAGKSAVAESCLAWFEAAGIQIGKDEQFGRADVVARHPVRGTVVVEVEGDSSKQKEQALYSALGQLLLLMGPGSQQRSFAVAVPDSPPWERQLAKVPARVRDLLQL